MHESGSFSSESIMEIPQKPHNRFAPGCDDRCAQEARSMDAGLD